PVKDRRAVREEAFLHLGPLTLEVRRFVDHDRPVGLDPLRDASVVGTMPFNRPPRSAPQQPVAEIAPPQAPAASSGKASLSVVTFVVPLMFAAVMFAFTKSVQFLLFAVLSPVMAVGQAVDGRLRGRKGERRE